MLHIPDRARLFAACHRALVPGGGMYIEDFTLRSEPTPAQREALRVKVQCPYVPPPDVYRRHILDAGFERVDLEDVTSDWTAFTAERLAAFRDDRDRLVRVHGEEVADGLEDFFATMAGLYADGVLGGARITASALIPSPAQIGCLAADLRGCAGSGGVWSTAARSARVP